MTKNSPTHSESDHKHDYLPAAGSDASLRFYDPFTKLMGVAKLHGRLIDQAVLADGQQVLEIGCGTGNLTIAAKRAQPGAQLVGSDPDPLALARAERKSQRLNGIRFERGYAQDLPYADATFDRVLSSLMLHHMDYDTKVAMAAEVRRVLRPGGSVHVVDFDGGDKHGLHALLSGRMARHSHLEDNRDDGIPNLFRAAGFECAQVSEYRHRIMGRVRYYRAVKTA